jgi:hypothetical protein
MIDMIHSQGKCTVALWILSPSALMIYLPASGMRVRVGYIEIYLIFNQDYVEMGFSSGIGCVIVYGVLVLLYVASRYAGVDDLYLDI